MKLRGLIGWGLGSFTSAALVGAVGLLHLRFMTDSLGIAIGMADYVANSLSIQHTEN